MASIENESNDHSTLPRKYNCSLCSASFQRREHLNRHHSSHSQAKNFECEVCHKQFARRDTWQRHLTIHGGIAARVQKTLPRASRACIHCVKSKQRCSGSEPCERCRRTNRHCHFSKGSVEKKASQCADLNVDLDYADRSVDSQGDSGSYYASWNPSAPIAPTRVTTPPDSLSQNENPLLECEASSLFDPFLLWPLDDDDAFEPCTMTSTVSSGDQTPSGFTRSLDLPTHVYCGTNPSSALAPLVSQDIPPQAGVSEVPEIHADGEKITDEDRAILASEEYGHIPKPSISIYNGICSRYAESTRYSQSVVPSLPTLEILHTCTELYFEHFHRHFPILHKGTFNFRTESWLLHLAVAALGIQYSRISIRAQVMVALMKIVRDTLKHMLSSASSLQNNLEIAQAVLLFSISLLFGGKREEIMHVQYQRNVLVTMCRPLIVSGVLFEMQNVSPEADFMNENWSQWIVTESWHRLAYFTWFTECLHLVLFDLPPLLAVEDMHLRMPCSDNLWQCPNFRDWERSKIMEGGKFQNPSIPTLLRIENLGKDYIQSLTESAQWISILSIYVAERQESQRHFFLLHHKSQDDRGCRSSPLGNGFSAAKHENDCVDHTLECFQQVITQRRYSTTDLQLATKLSHLVRLLRFIPYRLMYMGSGWMTRCQEADITTGRIVRLLRADPKQSRRTLLHAAQLFGIIRSQDVFEPYDSLVLLIATLYLWYYDRFVISEQSPSDMGSSPRRALRIDQDLSEETRQQWFAGNHDTDTQLHISGIGMINGQDSIPRILRGAMRILDHEKAWSIMAKAIRKALQQMLSGEAPSFAT